MENTSTWTKKDQENASYGHKIYYYESDGFKVTIQFNGSKYFIIDSNFDLCNIENYSARNIQSIFRQLNALFV